MINGYYFLGNVMKYIIKSVEQVLLAIITACWYLVVLTGMTIILAIVFTCVTISDLIKLMKGE